jgi:hypothetical protein
MVSFKNVGGRELAYFKLLIYNITVLLKGVVKSVKILVSGECVQSWG